MVKVEARPEQTDSTLYLDSIKDEHIIGILWNHERIAVLNYGKEYIGLGKEGGLGSKWGRESKNEYVKEFLEYNKECTVYVFETEVELINWVLNN